VTTRSQAAAKILASPRVCQKSMSKSRPAASRRTRRAIIRRSAMNYIIRPKISPDKMMTLAKRLLDRVQRGEEIVITRRRSPNQQVQKGEALDRSGAGDHQFHRRAHPAHGLSHQELAPHSPVFRFSGVPRGGWARRSTRIPRRSQAASCRSSVLACPLWPCGLTRPAPGFIASPKCRRAPERGGREQLP